MSLVMLVVKIDRVLLLVRNVKLGGCLWYCLQGEVISV